ncbi:MAG: Fur family transcriptional regulator [Chlamydiota bacterium]
MKKQMIITHAETFCIQQKERLTKPRLEVLKIVAASSKPMGAYEILKKLERVIDVPKPPTVYRALDFWVEKGFLHRIESLNAYVTCSAGHRHQGSQFMICDDCGIVIEAHLCQLPQALKERAMENTFKPTNWNVEIHGLCVHCQ